MRGYLKTIDKTYVENIHSCWQLWRRQHIILKYKVSGVRLPGLRLVCTIVWVWSCKNFLHLFFPVNFLKNGNSIFEKMGIYLSNYLPTYLHLSSIQLHEEILNIKWFNVNATLRIYFWPKQMLYVFLQTNQN